MTTEPPHIQRGTPALAEYQLFSKQDDHSREYRLQRILAETNKAVLYRDFDHPLRMSDDGAGALKKTYKFGSMEVEDLKRRFPRMYFAGHGIMYLPIYVWHGISPREELLD